MINVASIKNMTDSELINALEPTMHLSPIISELCTRLDNKIVAMLEIDKSKIETCPVCLADLSIIKLN